jgi:two-component system cell cycle response regulator
VSLFFPAMLLAIQWVTVRFGPGPGLGLGGLVVAADGWALAQGSLTLPVLLARAGFVALFAGAFGAVSRLEVLRLRRRADQQVERRVGRWLDDARDFRRIGAVLPSGSRPPRTATETARLRAIGSADAAHRGHATVFELVRIAVGADGVRVFLSTADDRLRELGTEDGAPFAPSGALGAVLKTGNAVHLTRRTDGPKLGYRAPSDVQAVAAVPVTAGPVTVGVLVAERSSPEPFDHRADEVLSAAAEVVVREAETETLLFDMDRTRAEQDAHLLAVRLIAEALEPDAVARQLAEAAARVSECDFVAVTLFDPEAAVHRIAARSGDDDRWLGHELPNDGNNIVAQALRARHPLPHVPLSEQPVRRDAQLFAGAELELRSVKVFPITHRHDGLGTIIVGSTRDPRRLPRDVEGTIESVAAQAAVSLANARLYAGMKRMATLDGLTGLVNHRRFHELLEAALERAGRLGHAVSVVFVDADHFKTINDSFGHPVGDEVLRRIADALRDEARRTDVVGRYGGEEFVLLLEATNAEGAVELAERARRRIEALQIGGDFGRLRVTVSLGVCTFPDLAEDRASLLSRADKALYEAKQRGRNRVHLYGASVCPQPETSDKGPEDAASSGGSRVPV